MDGIRTYLGWGISKAANSFQNGLDLQHVQYLPINATCVEVDQEIPITRYFML